MIFIAVGGVMFLILGWTIISFILAVAFYDIVMRLLKR